MAFRSKIVTTDKRKKFDTILRKFGELDGSFVTIGVHKKEGAQDHPGNPSQGRPSGNDPASIAEVAFFNEFGFTLRTGHVVPARSFIRAAVDEKRAKIEEVRDRQLNRVIVGRTSVAQGLKVLGFRIKSEIKNKMLRGPFHPNRPSTVARKGANKPLIDSTRMLRSIEAEVTVDRINKFKGLFR